MQKMIFRDYYRILELDTSRVSNEQIKNVYLHTHPRNKKLYQLLLKTFPMALQSLADLPTFIKHQNTPT